MRKFIDLLFYKSAVPVAFGAYHLFFLALTIFLCVFLALKFSKANEKQNKIIIRIFCTACLIMELYKQFVLNYNNTEYKFNSSYNWYYFPLQHCSMAMYVGWIATFLKEGRLQSFLYSYLAYFALFGNLTVLFTPASVFGESVGVNLQSMLHHCFMVVMGAYIIASGRAKINARALLEGGIVLTVMSIGAVIFNLSFDASGIGTNMFFLNPNIGPPVFIEAFHAMPFVIFFVCYVLILSVGAALTMLIAILAIRIKEHLRSTKEVDRV